LEFFADVKNYTSEGNPYVNASYVSEEGGVRRVYRRYANAGSPGIWSDTLRINEHSAATGAEVRPRLAYSPGAPGTGAGCVFAGAGLDNLYWNAPWHVTGVETPRGPVARPGVLVVEPNPCRDRLTVQLPAGARTVRISDATGRIVLSAAVPAGPSFAWDPGAVPAGVYFVAVDAGRGRSTATFVKQ
jgi:hypothetical protein